MAEDEEIEALLGSIESPEIITDRSIWALARNLRVRLFPRSTVRIHNGEIAPSLRYPLGMAWRSIYGLKWCPYCTSLHPRSAAELLSDYRFWNPAQAMSEMTALVERGEMDMTRETWRKAQSPTPGTAFGWYIVEDGEPVIFAFSAAPHHSIMVHLAHLYDMPTIEIPIFLEQMNRLAPTLHWSMAEDGQAQWSRVGFAIVDDDSDE